MNRGPSGRRRRGRRAHDTVESPSTPPTTDATIPHDDGAVEAAGPIARSGARTGSGRSPCPRAPPGRTAATPAVRPHTASSPPCPCSSGDDRGSRDGEHQRPGTSRPARAASRRAGRDDGRPARRRPRRTAGSGRPRRRGRPGSGVRGAGDDPGGHQRRPGPGHAQDEHATRHGGGVAVGEGSGRRSRCLSMPLRTGAAIDGDPATAREPLPGTAGRRRDRRRERRLWARDVRRQQGRASSRTSRKEIP